MKTFYHSLLILLLVITAKICCAQDVAGIYSCHSLGLIKLDLKPNGSFSLKTFPSCNILPGRNDSGEWKLVNDTITIKSGERTEQFIYFHKYTVISKYEFACEGNLLQFKNGDSASHFSFRFVKQKAYYPSGQTKWETNKTNNYWVTTNYFENGGIESTQLFKKNKKTGTWFYYNLTGGLSKIEKYRNGKLKKTLAIS